MLYECNYPRLLFYKYSPVLIPSLPILGFAHPFDEHQHSVTYIVITVVSAIVVAGLFFVVTAEKRNKFKYVAIGRDRIVVKRGRLDVTYTWLDVEKIEPIRLLGLYRMKLKGEENIYFTSYGHGGWLISDESDMGVIIKKMKSELQL